MYYYPSVKDSLSSIMSSFHETHSDETNIEKTLPYNYPKIFMSDVSVKSSAKKLFGRRKWVWSDLVTAGVYLSMHVLSLFSPFCFKWTALSITCALTIITGCFGLTLSYHRNLAHQTFKLPKWLEYTFAYCGLMALQGPPIEWVNTHRHHHQFSDSERDPHSPTEGFWFSHFHWIFDHVALNQKYGGVNKAMDLQKQRYYRFLQRSYIAHPIALGLLLYSLGGFSFLVWGMGVRTVLVFHLTWLIRSACHVWGEQKWNTGDSSRNLWLLALPTFGESWHNNHHAFESSARFGLEWWQIDIGWYVIQLLQAVGLATEVKFPTESQKHKLSSKLKK